MYATSVQNFEKFSAFSTIWNVRIEIKLRTLPGINSGREDVSMSSLLLMIARMMCSLSLKDFYKRVWPSKNTSSRCD